MPNLLLKQVEKYEWERNPTLMLISSIVRAVFFRRDAASFILEAVI